MKLNIDYTNTPNPHLKIIENSKLSLCKNILDCLINKIPDRKLNVLNIGGGYKKEAENYLFNHEKNKL
tara:strand:- start:603 stop:806 length:204 start_codon:yes stop_codon:yes gene_type:complete